MKDQIKVVVNSEEGVVSEVLLVNGETAALQVQENVSYEFQSVTEGVAPDELLVKRNGDNLEVYADASSATPLVTIEGYYLLAAPVPLVGMAENGEYFSFVPQTGVAAELPWNLADGASSYQGLGYGAVGSPVPWWPILLAGVLLLGGAAVAASSSSSSSKGAAIIDPTDEDSVFATAKGKVDDAKDAVKDAEQALEDALADGKITDEEVAELEKAIEDAEEALKDAQNKIDELPDGDAKDDIQGKLDEEKGKLEGIDVPASNEDAFNEAEQAVEDAAKAVEDAEKALEDALADGTVTPEEVAELEDANDNAQSKLDAAEEAVDNLPEGSAKDELDERVEEEQGKLDAIEVPKVTQDYNDAVEAVEAAEAADAAAQKALEDAKKDGTITPEEVLILEAAKDAAQTAKDEAQQAVDGLPEESQADLQGRLDALENIEVPEVSEDYAEALAAVKEAEKAHDAAHKALEEAEKDGVITPEEVEFLNEARAEAEQLKEAAQEKVDALDDNGAKDGLQGRIDALENIDEAEVTGEYAYAEAAVAAAEQKYADAENALEEALADNTITPEEVTELEVARDLAKATKDAAQEKVDALQDGEAKDGLQGRLDELEAIEVPEVTPGYEDALAAVEAAEEAYANAQKTLADANEDGVITPEEKAELEGALSMAEAAKDAAQGKVDALPEGEAQENLQERLDELEGFDVPEVTQDYADALDALEAAKDAVAEAEEKLAAAESDEVITPEEKAELEEAYNNAEEKLSEAQDAINKVPAGDAKDGLQDQFNEIENIDVPEVTPEYTDAVGALEDAKEAVKDAEQALEDAKEDGKITEDEIAELEDAIKDAEQKLDDAQDKVDALPEGDAKDDIQGKLDEEKGKLEDIDVPASNEDAFNEAEQAVEDAAKAVEDAEKALEDAQEDGKITDEEVAELEKAIEDAEEALKDAQDKVNELPDGDAKDDIQGELDEEKGKLEGIEVPESNEEDFTAAEKAVEDAAKAVDEAEQTLEDALADGKITDDVIAELEDAVSKAEDALGEAQDKVDALPEGSAKDDIQDSLNDEKGRLEDVEVPTNNEAAFDDAEQAVADAEQAVKDAEQAIEDAIAGGKITDEEAEALEKEVDDANQAVADAQEKVNALPDGTSKDAIQNNLDGVAEDAEALDAPTSNEADFDEAEQAVAEAEQAVQDAQGALEEAIADNDVTAEEVAELERLRDAAQDALNNANDKVAALPEGEDKTGLEDRLEALENITVPEEGTYDQDLTDAEAAVSAAEQAVQDAQDALTAANNDAFITPEEVADLQAKYQAAEDALGAAQAAVDALPASDAKNDFQDRINALDNITVPEVSDNFDQGVADAEAAVSAAEQAVQDALIRSWKSFFRSDLQAKYQAAEDALGAAQAAVDALPASDAKNDFQDRINALDNITVPEVSDNFDQGVADAEAAVSAAEQAVQDALIRSWKSFF